MAGLLRVGAVLVAVFACLVAIAHAQAPQLVADVAVTDNEYTPSASTVVDRRDGEVRVRRGRRGAQRGVQRVRVDCTTTKGAGPARAGKQVPFTSEGPGWQGHCTFPGPASTASSASITQT